MRGRHLSRITLAAVLSACGAQQAAPTTPEPQPSTDVSVEKGPEAQREAPPPSGTPRDIAFPPVHHVALDNGLPVDVVKHDQLPIVSLELVIQSGRSSDPDKLPGLASALSDMLREGTVKKRGAKFVEAVEYLGAHLHTSAGQETIRIGINALSEHFEPALALLAEAALMPAFDPAELEKLKKRTLDDLKLKKDRPAWLAQRELAQALYGDHPYARVDATEEAVKKLKRADLVSFHKNHFAPNNAFLVVVGDVSAEQVQKAAQKAFGAWRKKDVPEPTYAAPPERSEREIIVVDRPASVQSQIVIGNLALKRSDPRFISLLVANQVLGGSAASRLFMDLREKRSLTYGAYSRVDEAIEVGSFRASAAVRTEVTDEAMKAFFEHLDAIVTSPPPEEELAAAHRYLADSFPLAIETPARIGDLVADLRLFGLPDDYWDTFRSKIREVSAQEAHEAAKTFVHPERAVVVVVGRAADVVPAVSKLGNVRVVDVDGEPLTGDPGAAKKAAEKVIPPATAAPSVPATPRTLTPATKKAAAAPAPGRPIAGQPANLDPAAGEPVTRPAPTEAQTPPPAVPAPPKSAEPPAPGPEAPGPAPVAPPTTPK